MVKLSLSEPNDAEASLVVNSEVEVNAEAEKSNETPTQATPAQTTAALQDDNADKTQNGNSQSDQENQRPEQTVKQGKKQRHRKKGVPLPLEFISIKDYQPHERTGYPQESNGQPRKPRRRVELENPEPTEKLFVGGLPLATRDEALKEYFAQFGNVVEAQVKAERGFGFVTFESIAEADAALEVKDHVLEEKEIEVKRAIANNRYAAKPVPPRSGSDSGTGYLAGYTPSFYPGMIYSPQVVYPIPADGISPAALVSPAGAVNIQSVPTPAESVSPPNSASSVDAHTAPQVAFDSNGYYDEGDCQNHPNQQQKKLFIGGLHWKTNDDDLRQYFSTYGPVTDAMVIIEPNTQRSRGFGFVVFANPEVAETVVQSQNHKINDKVVDVKRAISKDDESDEIGKHIPVDKIFVGGIAHETTREALVSFFNTNFGGKVTRVDMKQDRDTGNHLGYAFLTLDSTEVVDNICQNKFHKIGPHLCEVKKAHPKDFTEQYKDNNNRGYSGRQASYYNQYTQYPVDGLNYSMTYSPMHFYYSVPMPIPAPHPQPPTQPSSTAPASANSSNGNGNEAQGEYIGGTWYPLSGKENGENGDNDESEEISHYSIPGYYPGGQAYNPTYACSPFFPYQYAAPYAQPVNDH